MQVYDRIVGAAFSPDASQVVFIGYKGILNYPMWQPEEFSSWL